ncbi:glycosyltransferase [Rhizobium esperanzae]|uniref:Glycosyltransferase 2-like domain-containing protein n=1 Tax=Rhizobium esperanzae TaxID=1967781 RepID=A0A7W6R3V9_9HYPH|nr:glycosyltransferase family 2 protein [Rhizobium esperanzae]MBB4235973.1 hypothetical protein [Rhizobium esperanzae]
MISIVLSTRDRANQLAQALEYFHGLIYDGNFEIIIVNNGSKDNTSEVIADFAAKATFPVHEVVERTPGLANARNAGVNAGKGDIFVFTDDDCYVDPNFLTEITLPFKWKDIGFVGGRITLFDETDALMTVRYDERPMTYFKLTFVPPGHIQGACMAFRKEVLQSIHNFDPIFGAGAHFPAEDFDAVLRTLNAGWYGIYWPEAHVRHHHGRKEEDVAKLLKGYSLGRGAVFAKLIFTEKAFKLARQMVSWRIRTAFKDRGSFYWELHGFFGYLKYSRNTPQ